MGKTFSTGLLTNGIWQDASNNIGIGGSPSGSYKLEVNGKGKFSNDLTVQHNQNASSTSTFSNSDTTGLGSRQYLEIAAGDVTLQLAAINTDAIYLQPTTSVSTYLGYNSAGGNALYLKPNGNVLVNTNTDAGYKLDVNGTGRFTGALTALSVTTTATSSVAFYSGTYVSTSLGDGSFGTYSSRIRENTSYGLNIDLYDRTAATWRTPLSFNNTGGAATFSSSVTATLGNAASLLLRSGNAGQYTFIGIGRTSDDMAVGVAGASSQFFTGSVAGDAWVGATNGTIGFGNGTTGIATMVVKGGNVGIGLTTGTGKLFAKQTTANFYEGINCYASANDSFTGIGHTSSLGVVFSSYNVTAGAYTPLAFFTSDTERLRITSGGNVGIGTSSPNARLSLGNTTSTAKLLLYDGGFTGSGGNGYFAGFAIDSPNANDTTLLAHYQGALVFGRYTNANDTSAITERMRITSGGGVGIGTTTVTGTTKLRVINSNASNGDALMFVDNAVYNGIGVYSAGADGYNGAATVMILGRNSSTTRSINAGGTINASGTDYAEYMTKAIEDNIAKGDIVGVDVNGLLTNIFANAKSFVVKSTDPSYVGGDSWGNIDDIGKLPLNPTDEEKAKHEAKLEQARVKVDRIAFSGQVPCNVYDANVGDYIIPINDNGTIKGEAITNPTFEQYQLSVGKVWKIMEDGRAWIAVKIG